MNPDLTLVLEVKPEEILRRMQVRVDNHNHSARINANGHSISSSSVPRVWLQSSECFARIIQTFREFVQQRTDENIKIVEGDQYIKYIDQLLLPTNST